MTTLRRGSHRRPRTRDATRARNAPPPCSARRARCRRGRRERSFRPRSTSIRCSARSFSEESSRSTSPSVGSVVPAIGQRLAVPSSHATRRSGTIRPARRRPAPGGRGRATGSRDAGRGRRRAARRRSGAPLAARARTGRRRPRRCGPSRRAPSPRSARGRRNRRSGPATPSAPGARGCRPRAYPRPPRGRPRDIGGAGAVVEPHERLRDDEPALREPMALGRERNGRLEAGDVVVGEIADDGQPELLRLVEGDEAGPAPIHELRPRRPRSTDSSRARAPDAAQPQVRPERGEEVGRDHGTHEPDSQPRSRCPRPYATGFACAPLR